MLTAAILLAASASAFDQVVAAERAFAAASVEKGIDAAFLMFLAEDAIEFGPTPRPARPAHENKERTASTLNWGPEWVAVSAAGDLALSTGPYLLRGEGPSAIGVTGLFLSVWRREKDGSWKVVVDSGLAAPFKFAMPATVKDGSAPKSAKARPSDAESAGLAITAAELEWAGQARSGIGDAVAKRVETEARIYRGRQPVGAGQAGARALLATDKRRADCKPDRVAASASGDLGYAYGTCAGDVDGKPSRYGFLHVWRRQADGAWKILVDVTP
jgi:ketosteroid isomerase-like protein